MPAERVLWFHIGGHKTGTTFLQNVLWHNRDRLRRDGLLYPGRGPNAHVWANLDLRRAGFKGYRAPQVAGAWPRLVRDIAAWDGPAIIDHELFSLVNPRQLRRALQDLSFAEVHVVFTARDMARQLPAAWQEWIKNRDTITYAEFLTSVRGDTEQARRLRSLHDVPAILATWSAQVPAERVHVVTVPPPGAEPGVLWQRFAGLLGLDPAGYSTDIPATNSSLGASEATVVRRLNALLADVDQPGYDRDVKFYLAPELGKRRGARIDLPEDAYAWAVEQAQAAVAALGAAGYDVVGDLAELVPSRRPAGADPDRAPADELADAAIEGLAALVRRPASGPAQRELRQLRARLAETEQRLARAEARDPVRRLRGAAGAMRARVRKMGNR